jgi:dihydrofolate synthase/folylpolyglutamate synthase
VASGDGRSIAGVTAQVANGPVAEAYERALRELADRGRFGVHLGLGRIRALLRELGHPERSLRGALVGGTNGKGSVLALAGAALRAAGLRVGETPKPHLVTYRERLVLDGQPIAASTFARLVEDVAPLADRVARRLGPPTEFELLTAMLFRWFAEERVDVALVEVGLGGRLDATHAWDGGVAAITNVALDHMDRLGDTIPAIAREKAAIIERGDLAVTGASGAALEVIRRRAGRVGAPLVEVAPPRVLGVDRDGIDVELPRLGRTRIGLRGRHQAGNAAVADAVLDALAEAGIATAPEAARRAGYAAARWPGRLELLQRDGHDVLLDGAHNPAAAAALATALDDLRPLLRDGSRPWTLVVGAMVDKDVTGTARALASVAGLGGARIIATRVDLPRAMPAEALAATWRTILPASRVESIPDVGRALDAAVRGAAGPVVVAGSLYLVGEARRRWVDDPLLRDPEVGLA